MSSIKSEVLRPAVIVRAFDDEPVQLTAHRLDLQKNRVLVGQSNAQRPISLPLDEVFDYDDKKFQRLKQAYSSGDKQTLQTLYADFLRDKRSCNKYQDALLSAHEEKAQVADSRSAA